jgi:hypothetical protein
MRTPPPLGKVIIFPLVVATLLAVLIAVLTPEVGPFAYVSAWIGTFAVLMVWGFLHHVQK